MFIYKCYLSEGFWCKVDGHRYNVIKEKKADEIKKYMDSSKNENHYLRLWFTFTDIPIINEQGFQLEIKEKKYYMTYNVIKKSNENFTVNVKNDGIDIRLISIRESFLFYITNRFLKINEIINEINRKRSKENLGCFIHKANFKLYYFKDFGTCFENVKKFSLNIRRLRLVKDEDFETLTVETSGSSLDKDCNLKISQFMERLRSKFDQLQGYKLDLSGPSRCISTETLEILFKKACNHLKEKIMSKNILIPIGKDSGIEYYLEELFKIIYRVITSIYKTYDTIPPEEEDAIFKFLFKSLDELYKNFETASVKNVFESEYVHKYFAELLGREVKDLNDFTIVEKMVLDHRNMISYIYNTIDDYDKEITNKYIFRSPYFVDAFKYRLLEGIEFETSHRSEWEMYGIDNEENRFKLEEDVDYFNLYRKAPIAYTMKELEEIGCVNENMYIFCKTYVFSERMRELNIVTIEFHNDRLVDALGLPVFKNVKGLCEKNYAEIGDLLKN